MPPTKRKSRIWTAPELAGAQLPKMRWVIPDLLPEGLTILVGKRKEGKSWLALNLALAVAEGDDLFGYYDNVDEGSVLYIAYEDTAARLQRRLHLLSTKPDARLRLITDAPRAPALYDTMEKWANTEPNPRLVILDVLTTAMPQGERLTRYERTYELLEPIWQFAGKHHVAVVAVHHPTKGKNNDPLDAVRGAGVVEAFDTIWFLKKDPVEPHADLFVSGRDIENPRAVAISFEDGHWNIVDDINPKQQAIRMVIVSTGRAGISPKDVTARLAKTQDPLDYEYVKKTMYRMEKKGKLQKDANGRYREP